MNQAAPKLRLSRFWTLEFSNGGHPVTGMFSQRGGAVFAWLGFRLGLSPNQLTVIACLTSVAGALTYALPGSGVMLMILAIVLTQTGYALDCADGQLARGSGRTSALGRWLDVYLDMLTITSLSFAALYRIYLAEPALAPWATLATGFYCYARVGNIFTCTLARASTAGGGGHDKGFARKLFLIAIDTPVVLLCIGLLRHHPVPLLTYLAAVSVPFTVHSLYVGTRTSKRPA
jgi:phosphatidylglycerophosphate synthase